MGQRVRRSAERTARIRATFVPSPAPDDLDALTEAYFSLSDEVNNSPPIIRDGDAHIGPLVVCYCQQCGARVAAAFVTTPAAVGERSSTASTRNIHRRMVPSTDRFRSSCHQGEMPTMAVPRWVADQLLTPTAGRTAGSP